MHRLARSLLQTILTTSVKAALESLENKNKTPHNLKIAKIREDHAMAVKSIKANIQQSIVEDYTSKKYNIMQLAKLHHTSARTVGRIIEEHGLATPMPRLRGEAYEAMKLLTYYGLTVDDLHVILEGLETYIIEKKSKK